MTALPFAPLEEYVAHRWPEAPARQGGGGTPRLCTDVHISILIGKHRTRVSRWRSAGEVPLEYADAAAIELGVHPWCVWRDDYLKGTG